MACSIATVSALVGVAVAGGKDGSTRQRARRNSKVTEARSNAKIQVKRAVHIRQPDILEEAMVMSVGYVSPDRNVLMASVGYGRQREYYFRSRGKKDPRTNVTPHAIQVSVDNGCTWKQIEEWPEYLPLRGDRRMCRREPNWLYNPKTGTLLRIYGTHEDIDGVLPWDPRSPVPKTGRLYTQISRDGGKTWGRPEQLIIRGGGHDETHWAPGLWYGKNSGGVEGVAPVFCEDQRFLLPLYAKRIDKAGDPLSGKGQSACLIGRWRDDDSGVDWDMTAYATVPRPHSNCGGDEPSVAVLPGGKLLMTMRVRVDPKDGTTTPSGRWFVTSDDMGKTWSAPQLLRYDDGQQVYNPACLAHVFRSGKNGRLYIITNILDSPTHGCDPRTALHIAEIDMTTLRVVRDTVTAIESRDPAQGQPPNIRFSNWRRYEDRQTKNIVLFMTGCPGNVGRHETCGVPPHSFRYEIILPRG